MQPFRPLSRLPRRLVTNRPEQDIALLFPGMQQPLTGAGGLGSGGKSDGRGASFSPTEATVEGVATACALITEMKIDHGRLVAWQPRIRTRLLSSPPVH